MPSCATTVMAKFFSFSGRDNGKNISIPKNSVTEYKNTAPANAMLHKKRRFFIKLPACFQDIALIRIT